MDDAGQQWPALEDCDPVVSITEEVLGGDLEIEWNEENNRVYMTGPAETVFEGEL